MRAASADDPSEESTPRLSRRALLRAGMGLSASALCGSGAWGYVASLEPHWLQHSHVELPIVGLNAALDGLRIVQLSDLHATPEKPMDLIAHAVDLANSLQPDIVALTGDFVSAGAASDAVSQALERLNPRLALAAVPGNHDYWTDLKLLRANLRRVGIDLLINGSTSVAVGDSRVHLLGLDDYWSGASDLATARWGVPEQAQARGEPLILLAHEPDPAAENLRDSGVTLQLSGHSHGGQVRLPGIGALVLPRYARHYDSGLYRVADGWLYVNRGIGTIEPDVRFGCRPEVTEIVLRVATPDGPADG